MTANSLHEPGMPLSSCPPRSSKVIPELAMRSRTVEDARISPASVNAAARDGPGVSPSASQSIWSVESFLVTVPRDKGSTLVNALKPASSPGIFAKTP